MMMIKVSLMEVAFVAIQVSLSPLLAINEDIGELLFSILPAFFLPVPIPLLDDLTKVNLSFCL